MPRHALLPSRPLVGKIGNLALSTPPGSLSPYVFAHALPEGPALRSQVVDPQAEQASSAQA